MFWLSIALVAIALALLIAAVWTLKKNSEKYGGCCRQVPKDYAPMYLSGKPIAGTVYANNPYSTPGLGWVV